MAERVPRLLVIVLLLVWLAPPAAADKPITRGIVLWHTNDGGVGRLFGWCLRATPVCAQAGLQFTPDLGNAASNVFPPFVAAPAVDANSDLILVDESPSALPQLADAATVRRVEDGRFPPQPDGRVSNAGLLGGFSGQPGPVTPTDTVLLRNRVLHIADAGPSSATFDPVDDVRDGRILKVDPVTGRASVLAAGVRLVNPSALAEGPGGELLVADVRAGVSPASPVLLAVDPVTGAQTEVAASPTLQVLGPAIDIALLGGGDLLWLSNGTGVFASVFAVDRVDPQTGATSKIAQRLNFFGPPTGLAVDTGASPDDLVLLSTPIDPAGGDGLGAFYEVDELGVFSPLDPAANLSLFATGLPGSFLASYAPAGLAIPPLAECNDGIANVAGEAAADFDGAPGLPPAPGCSGRFDVSERLDCDDDLDNDLDGIADELLGIGPEPGCRSLGDASEEPDCADGSDDDGDGVRDTAVGSLRTCLADSDCSGGATCHNGFCSPALLMPGDDGCLDDSGVREDPQCSDGVDNDGDGQSDWPADPECAGPSENAEAVTGCNDGVDNDGDGQLDFAGGIPVRVCTTAADCGPFQSCVAGLCSPGHPAPPDTDCEHAADPSESGDACGDGLDNDGDGLVDLAGGILYAPCNDVADCSAGQSCVAGRCTPGLPVGGDPQCDAVPGAVENPTACNDDLDNDGDGLIDLLGVATGEVCASNAECQAAAACQTASAVAGKPADCRCLAGSCRIGDPGCRNPDWLAEDPACDDGLENETDPGAQDDRIDYFGLDLNGDGQFVWADGDRYPDPGCAGSWALSEQTACNDGMENDNPPPRDSDGTDASLAGLPCDHESDAALHCGYHGICMGGTCSPGEEPDEGCLNPSSGSEGYYFQGTLCGLGAELVLLVPLLRALYRRRRLRPRHGRSRRLR